MTEQDEWTWMVVWCKKKRLPPAQKWAWDMAKEALKQHSLTSVDADTHSSAECSGTDASATSLDVNRIKTLDEKITEIASLPDNWNGNGASRFSADVVERARSVAKVLEGCSFECFPTGNNSIQFEKTASGQYLELEVFADRVEAYNETESRLTDGITDQQKVDG